VAFLLKYEEFYLGGSIQERSLPKKNVGISRNVFFDKKGLKGKLKVSKARLPSSKSK
jgi:hypothetical protein